MLALLTVNILVLTKVSQTSNYLNGTLTLIHVYTFAVENDQVDDCRNNPSHTKRRSSIYNAQ